MRNANIKLGQPRFNKPDKLLIEKVEGPFDDKGNLVENPVKGKTYTFKAYSNTVTYSPLYQNMQVKWAKMGKSQIEEFPRMPLNILYLDTKKNCYVSTTRIPYQYMRLYAYIESPSEKASLLCKAPKGYHYKGTKKWGKLQDKNEKGELDFSALNNKVTETELNANLDDIGRQNVAILKKISALDYEGADAFGVKVIPKVPLGQSIIETIYEYVAGTRQVLSDDDDIENKVIDNFYKFKTGKLLSFPENSIQSKKLHTYQPFQNYFKNYLEVIKILLREKTLEKKNGIEIISLFRDQLKTSFKPDFSIKSDILSHDYYGLMGGTQTIKVDLEVSELDNNKYEVKTKMYIGDWYGSDWGDINGGNLAQFLDEIKFDWKSPIDSISRIKEAGKKIFNEMFKDNLKGNVPSLNAFFWLQHYYGCHPFESEIIYQDTNVIEL